MKQKKLLSSGSLAPQISGKDQLGQELSLAQFKGNKIALFFYPGDDTPTCTKEACNLRDHFTSLQDDGWIIIGVSPDNEKSHLKFIEKYQLPFPLIADTDHQWLNAFGVWGEKNKFGKTYEGVHRTTYLIDEEGIIKDVIEKVNSADHTQQIIDRWNDL